MEPVSKRGRIAKRKMPPSRGTSPVPGPSVEYSETTKRTKFQRALAGTKVESQTPTSSRDSSPLAVPISRSSGESPLAEEPTRERATTGEVLDNIFRGRPYISPEELQSGIYDIMDAESDLESVGDVSWDTLTDSSDDEAAPGVGMPQTAPSSGPSAPAPSRRVSPPASSSLPSAPAPSSRHSSPAPPTPSLDRPVPSLDPHTLQPPRHAPQAQSFTWLPDPPSNPPSFPFRSQRQLLVTPDGQDQLDFLKLLLTDDILDLIIEETNRFALFLKNGATPGARINRWKPITQRNELVFFFGLLFLTGSHDVPNLKEIWTTNSYFGGMMRIHYFSETMTRDRFSLILQCLHFAKKPESGEPQPTDRLYKVRPMITHFNNIIRCVFSPGRNLSLDESMVLWRGRLSFRQYIQTKRHKYGIKLYVLAEPTGVPIRFLVYSGSGDSEVGGKGHTERVVRHLIQDMTGQGHCLYMDNMYNSVTLATSLIKQQTYVTGTLRTNRLHNPAEVVSARLVRGNVVQRYSSDGVCVLKWRDKREVLVISTEATGDLVDVRNRRGQVLRKPQAVVNYNQFMCGVDRMDQLMAYYPCERKTLKWYKKLGIHILQLHLLASFHFFNLGRRQRQPLHLFRLNLIRQMTILDYDNRPKQYSIPAEIVVGRHFPSKMEEEGGEGKKRRKQINCRHCYATQKKAVKTTYFCKGCEPINGRVIGLCIDCFDAYHP